MSPHTPDNSQDLELMGKPKISIYYDLEADPQILFMKIDNPKEIPPDSFQHGGIIFNKVEYDIGGASHFAHFNDTGQMLASHKALEENPPEAPNWLGAQNSIDPIFKELGLEGDELATEPPRISVEYDSEKSLSKVLMRVYAPFNQQGTVPHFFNYGGMQFRRDTEFSEEGFTSLSCSFDTPVIAADYARKLHENPPSNPDWLEFPPDGEKNVNTAASEILTQLEAGLKGMKLTEVAEKMKGAEAEDALSRLLDIAKGEK